jgi:RNA polymerase sigma-70 factor (ECF subfamily)
VDEVTAERAFERRWAFTLLDTVLNQLRAESESGGRIDLFDRIKGKLTHVDDHEGYREIAADLGMTEGAVKVAIHRLRKRYRELLIHDVSQTVATAGEIDDEIGELFRALSR